MSKTFAEMEELYREMVSRFKKIELQGCNIWHMKSVLAGGLKWFVFH